MKKIYRIKFIIINKNGPRLAKIGIIRAESGEDAAKKIKVRYSDKEKKVQIFAIEEFIYNGIVAVQ